MCPWLSSFFNFKCMSLIEGNQKKYVQKTQVVNTQLNFGYSRRWVFQAQWLLYQLIISCVSDVRQWVTSEPRYPRCSITWHHKDEMGRLIMWHDDVETRWWRWNQIRHRMSPLNTEFCHSMKLDFIRKIGHLFLSVIVWYYNIHCVWYYCNITLS